MPTESPKNINVVCFGGGTGLPVLLSGLKQNPLLSVTAVVNMFDSGGSSGVLRDQFGILPPGDILKCLLALSEDEHAARKILLARTFKATKPGHSAGNLLLFALERVYNDYHDAIDALGNILSVQGQVIPVTITKSTLCASYIDGEVTKGETTVDEGLFRGKKIERLFLDPAAEASEKAIRAIEQADVLCIGPGSFYTSVLPNFLPTGIREAIASSPAPVIFIANLLTEGWGMKDLTVSHVIDIVEAHIGRKVTRVVANMQYPSDDVIQKYKEERKELLLPVHFPNVQDQRITAAPLWGTDTDIARHDSSLLAHAVFRIIVELIKR